MMGGEPREPPNYEDAIQAFLSWIDDVQSFEIIDPDTSSKRPFVVADLMRKYFEDDNNRELKKLISAHFADAGNLWVDDIVPDNVAVFCTLLSISKGWWIKNFSHYGDLSDTALPFDPVRPPPSWPSQGADFLQQFCDAQWQFCAPVLRAPFVGKRFPKDIVLPIISKESLNAEGSSASLWIIKIHPSYNNLISEVDKEKLGPHANTFVMKTYFTSEAEKYYDTEAAAFRHIGSHPSIIKFYGSFSRGDNYNILLEYADQGTLADYLKNESPPSEGEEIIRFWESMFKLVDALRRIHEVGSDDLDDPRLLQGRHQDVKPENVLIVSNGSENPCDWIFKLADLGITSFKGGKPGRRESSDKATRGTRTYGAPESYRPDETYVHDSLREGQNSDIWSLGCIYSEAARWLKDGHRGVQAYRQERQGETSQIQGFRDGDCFHDGEKMLTCVRQSHKNSVRNLRPEDCITRSVVEVLIGDMLGIADARSSAYTLYQKSKQLIIDAKTDLEAVRKQLDPPSLPKATSDSGNRSFTIQNYDSRPPTPPNPPPDFFPPIESHIVPQNAVPQNAVHQNAVPQNAVHQNAVPQNAVPQNAEIAPLPDNSSNNHPLPQILGPSDTNTTEGVGNKPGFLTSPENSNITDEMIHQSPQVYSTIMHSEPEDIAYISHATDKRQDSNMTNTEYYNDTVGTTAPAQETRVLGPVFSSVQHSRPTTAATIETQYELTQAPQSQASFPVTFLPSHPQLNTVQESVPPQRSPSTRLATENALRPKASTIQGSPKLPNLPLEDALEWRRKRKGNKTKMQLKDWQYLDRLQGRDHVFLIDDSNSMREHWKNVLKVFETLPYIVKEVDPDGFDLWFTGPSKPLANCRSTTEPLEAVELRRQIGTTDITVKLGLILDEYITALENPKTGIVAKLSSKPVKPLSIYVFTDGVWEEDCDGIYLIENAVRRLEILCAVKGKVGIQFISFGEDPVGIDRMELLDSGLNVKLDIVDTEPWNGNVWKMLLGSINDSFDKINDKHDSGEIRASTSSNRRSMTAS